jgi:hypothetical protein
VRERRASALQLSIQVKEVAMTRLSKKHAVCAAGAVAALLVLHAGAARAVRIRPGQPYQAMVVACGTQAEAEVLRGLVVSGRPDEARDYLAADGNSCAAGPARFIAIAQVGEAKTDTLGNTWKIVEIVLPASEAYLVTTADVVAGERV